MLMQEPVQVAIWTSLNFYAFEDAIFLAERLLAEVDTDENVYLLATCYYRSGRINEAYWLLNARGAVIHKSKFLLAKCAYDLKHYKEAERVLCNNKIPLIEADLDEICKDYGIALSGFVMQLLSKICHHTARASLASGCCRASLKNNPFLWQSFSDMCNRGERPCVEDVFKIHSDEVLIQFEKELLNATNITIVNDKNISVITTPNNNPMTTAAAAAAHKFDPDSSDDTALFKSQSADVLYFDTDINSSFTPTFGVLPMGRHSNASPLQQQTKSVSNLSNLSPQEQQNIRRFPLNYSVKENSLSPKIAGLVQPPSPPRKSKRVTRAAKSNPSALSEKIETVTSEQMITFDINEAHNGSGGQNAISSMRQQSADGLMTLLRSLGEAYLHLQHYETDEALNILEAKIPIHHFNSSWVQSLLALIYHEKREYEQAVKIFAKIHNREPHRLQYLEIYSTDLWHLRKDTLLSSLSQDLMDHSKTSPITWCVAGNCYSAVKERDTAIKFFKRAIQLDPEFAYSYTLLGHELAISDQLEKALECYRKAILKDSRHYNAWFGIGNIYSQREQYQLAELHFRQAYEINRRNSIIMVHIGIMQFASNRREQAIQTLQKASKLDPKDPLCKFHHASMNYKMGKLQEAQEELEELKQILPNESVVYYLIGQIHEQLKHPDLALMHFSWASDLDPKGANKRINYKFQIANKALQRNDNSDDNDNDSDDHDPLNEDED